MPTEKQQHYVHASLAFTGVAAVGAVLLGVLALVGWVTGVEFLKSFLHPNRIPMNPATAVCFILCGIALWLAREPYRTRGRDVARLLLSLAAVAIGTAKLIDLLPHVQLDVDEVLFPARLGGN